MRSAKVIPISDDSHFADYAEFVHTEEGPVEKVLREDKSETCSRKGRQAMIPRRSAWICLDCDMVMRPTKQGRCEFCGSQAIYPLVRVVEKKQPEKVGQA